MKVRIYTVNRPTALEKMRTTFEVADYTNGKRRFRVFTDETQAKREAERIARQLATGESTAASMRNTDAASYGRAIELLRPTGASLEVGRRHYAKAYGILCGDAVIEAANSYARHRADKISPRKVADVVAELVAAKEGRKSTRYVADLRARLNRFASSFAVDIGTITGPEVQGWLDRLKVAPRTAKNFRSCLCTLFSFAESHGYGPKGGNPAADTDEISTDDDEAIEIFTPAEIVALLNAAPSAFQPVLPLEPSRGCEPPKLNAWNGRTLTCPAGLLKSRPGKPRRGAAALSPFCQI